jgi:uncharacterized protein YacL
MNQTILLLRFLFLAVCAAAGWHIADKVDWLASWQGSFIGLAAGLFIILLDVFAKGVSLRAFSSATFGLTLGLVLATLVSASKIFTYASPDAQWVIHLSIYLSLGYLGTMLALRSNRDEFSLVIPYVRFLRQDPREQVNLLDTSAIIDGRVGELCKSGFIEGTLVVPRFVLDELQKLADSPDAGRRTRGRTGLDLLKELMKLTGIELKIHETTPASDPVDHRLLHLARVLSGKIITTDYNLARSAEIQNIRTLNIHLLANAVRTQVMTGDLIRLKLVREGKEPHQAVGFLPDGTMIVVNHARSMLGQETEVTISGAIQTTAGRMIFADLSKPSQ